MVVMGTSIDNQQIRKFREMLADAGVNRNVVVLFQTIICSYHRAHGRVLPWRSSHTPYHVLVSEIMLQQTQVERVRAKFNSFIRQFPDFMALANGTYHEVLKAWSGLGYNRRALALKTIAMRVVQEYAGSLPSDVSTLITFPGIGRTTASAIATFAFNHPTTFIETNIRTVIIHFFFPGKERVTDKEIFPLIERTLLRENPREWYYALMDYGAMLKRQIPSINKRRQPSKIPSQFKGSNRQIRGKIIKILIDKIEIGEEDLIRSLSISKERLSKILEQLSNEGFLEVEAKKVRVFQGRGP